MNITKQRLFDRAISIILKQGCLGNDKTGQCIYITPQGNRCVIGGLVPVEILQAITKEDTTANGSDLLTCGIDDVLLDDNVISKYLIEHYQLEPEDYNFFRNLQIEHDASSSMVEFIRRAKSFANITGLNTLVFDE